MFLARISINNPVFATMMMAALLVVGLFAYRSLGVDQFPNIDFPTVAITTTYPGASPEMVESEVTRKIEDAVNTISGVDTLTSRSFEGRSVVTVQFNLFTNSAVAIQDVREKVAAIRSQLRKEVDEPTITRFTPDDLPIVSTAIESSSRELRELTTLADQVIVKRLQAVRGVGKATIVGGVKRQIEIRLKPERLQALSLSVDQVIGAIRVENQDLPAGSVMRGREDRVVQLEGRLKDPADFVSLIVAQRGGAPVRLGEIADVTNRQVRGARVRGSSAALKSAVLAFSNGGLKTAYGAGLLVGWGETGKRPHITAVTAVGVSALIAPFAFIGAEGDQKVADIFTCEAKSLSDMAHRAASYVDSNTLKKIACRHEEGARLQVALPGSAARGESIWNIGAIAASGHPKAQWYIENILLAAVDLTTLIDPATLPIAAGALVSRNLTFRQVGAGERFLSPGQTLKPAASYLFHNGLLFPDESEAYMAKRREVANGIAHLAMVSVVPAYDFFLAAQASGGEIHIASIRPHLSIEPRSGFDMSYLRALFLDAYRQGRMSREWRNTFPDRDTSRNYGL